MHKQNLTKTTIKLLLFCFLIATMSVNLSCKQNKYHDKNIDDEIVLQIDSFKITKYEFEKNKKRAIDSKAFRNTDDWLDDYTNNAYFLADAYKKNYDTISEINKTVNYAALTMLGQYKGYLWNKVEEPKLNFSKKEIKSIYKKQNKIFDLEYFIFPDLNTFYSVLKKDTSFKSGTDFYKVIEKSKKSNIKYNHSQLLYPFDQLEPVKNIIYSLDENEATKIPYTDDKILVIHLKKVSERKQKDFEREKATIENRYRHFKERYIVYSKREHIYNKANIHINNNIKDLVLKVIEEPSLKYDNTSLLSDTILNYTRNNQQEILLVSDFIDYCKHNPLIPIITSSAAMEETLKGFVLEQYIYLECVNLGITDSKEFLLDRKNYKNSLILETYIRDNFFTEEIPLKELQEYYNSNKKNFTTCKECSACILTFKNINSALPHMFHLDQIATQGGVKNQSDTLLMNLKSYQPNVTIDYTNKEYPPEIIEQLFTSGLNKRIGPLKMNNKAVVLVKTEETGQEVMPFEVAQEAIKKQLGISKMEKLKANKLQRLKKQYSITINNIQQQ